MTDINSKLASSDDVPVTADAVVEAKERISEKISAKDPKETEVKETEIDSCNTIVNQASPISELQGGEDAEHTSGDIDTKSCDKIVDKHSSDFAVTKSESCSSNSNKINSVVEAENLSIDSSNSKRDFEDRAEICQDNPVPVGMIHDNGTTDASQENSVSVGMIHDDVLNDACQENSVTAADTVIEQNYPLKAGENMQVLDDLHVVERELDEAKNDQHASEEKQSSQEAKEENVTLDDNMATTITGEEQKPDYTTDVENIHTDIVEADIKKANSVDDFVAINCNIDTSVLEKNAETIAVTAECDTKQSVKRITRRVVHIKAVKDEKVNASVDTDTEEKDTEEKPETLQDCKPVKEDCLVVKEVCQSRSKTASPILALASDATVSKPPISPALPPLPRPRRKSADIKKATSTEKLNQEAHSEEKTSRKSSLKYNFVFALI